MCIAIFKPEGKIIPRHQLLNCMESNWDGAGFVVHFRNKNSLYMEKGFFQFDKFWESWEKWQEHRALLHFRIRTSGYRDAPNCHPFMVTPWLAMVHNGIIQIPMPDHSRSDTSHFADEVGNHLKENFRSWKDNQLQEFLEQERGFSLFGSKLIFMDRWGNVKIHNEQWGSWENDCWFSNSGYKFSRYGGSWRQGKKVYLNQPEQTESEPASDEQEFDESTFAQMYRSIKSRREVGFRSNQVCASCKLECTTLINCQGEMVCVDCLSV